MEEDWRFGRGSDAVLLSVTVYARERPVGCMANGSLHDELLSVRKARTASLAPRINKKRRKFHA